MQSGVRHRQKTPFARPRRPSAQLFDSTENQLFPTRHRETRSQRR